MGASCCPPPKHDQCCSPPSAIEAEACCPPAQATEDCCAPDSSSTACCPGVVDDQPGFRLWPFVCGWLEGPNGRIPQVATRLTSGDVLGRWQMRWGLGRMRYSLAPGLYAIGKPTGDSPALVTANYKMTFDILRRDLHGLDAWLLVLDTKGINVWCAAGKGTFGTDEIVRQVRKTGLAKVVSHRTLIVPQLGAPGVAAHKVNQACGFKIVYGPVRSADLPRFLDSGQTASAEMRRVSFTLVERLILTPVELVNMRTSILWSSLVLFVLGGIGPQVFSLSAAWQRGGLAVAAGLAGLLTGSVVTPLLLPWLPGRAFAIKGAIAGLAAAILIALSFAATLDWQDALALLLVIPAVASWCGMHFTGSSTFTSPSGVEKEMRRAIPAQATALLVAGCSWLAGAF